MLPVGSHTQVLLRGPIGNNSVLITIPIRLTLTAAFVCEVTVCF
jgi:hypothetical protein